VAAIADLDELALSLPHTTKEPRPASGADE
jgi:hypothetical protein